MVRIVGVDAEGNEHNLNPSRMARAAGLFFQTTKTLAFEHHVRGAGAMHASLHKVRKGIEAALRESTSLQASLPFQGRGHTRPYFADLKNNTLPAQGPPDAQIAAAPKPRGRDPAIESGGYNHPPFLNELKSGIAVPPDMQASTAPKPGANVTAENSPQAHVRVGRGMAPDRPA